MRDRHRNHNLFKRCDCARRHWAKCPHTWWFAFKPPGGPHYRISLDKHAQKHIDRKSDAEDLAATIRTAIKAGTYGAAAPVMATLTGAQLLNLYDTRYLRDARAASADNLKYQIAKITATPLAFPTGGTKPLGDWCVVDVTTDVIEQYREVRRPAGPAATNRDLSLLRAMFSWAVRVGYLEMTPFKKHSEPVIKLTHEPPRSRRLHDDEAARLLAACNPHVRGIVECALETGMRRGEILSLQWSQVEGLTIGEDGTTMTWAARPVLSLPFTKTKTRTTRQIPISTRLRAVLELRRLDPNGQPHPPSAYVFGSTIGTKVEGFQRAWHTAVLKAHGHTPEYTDSANLTPESRAALAAIDLHFHDLRREAGSRWMDGGVPLATIQRWLGHSNIAQTSTYLSGTPASEHDAMKAYEARLTAVQQRATDARTGGRKSPPAAVRPDRKPKNTSGNHAAAIM